MVLPLGSELLLNAFGNVRELLGHLLSLLLVTQRQIRRGQAVVVALHHEFAVELFGRAPFGRINP